MKSESFLDYGHIKFIVLNSLNSLLTFVDNLPIFFYVSPTLELMTSDETLSHKMENTPAQVKLYN